MKKRSRCPACRKPLRKGQAVRVVPIFSAHDPRNYGGEPTAPPIREDLYHPTCADRLGLTYDPAGGIIWLEATP